MIAKTIAALKAIRDLLSGKIIFAEEHNVFSEFDYEKEK